MSRALPGVGRLCRGKEDVRLMERWGRGALQLFWEDALHLLRGGEGKGGEGRGGAERGGRGGLALLCWSIISDKGNTCRKSSILVKISRS